MSHQRFEITCPHCRRSYALSVDPDNIASESAMAKCGRCHQRFRLSAALAALGGDADKEPADGARGTYRKRMSRPQFRRITEDDADQKPAAVVDEIAVAFERALQERRRLQENAQPTDGAEDPSDDEAVRKSDSGHPATKRRLTPQVAFRFTPPPTARELMFGSNLGALDDTDPSSGVQRLAERAETPPETASQELEEAALSDPAPAEPVPDEPAAEAEEPVAPVATATPDLSSQMPRSDAWIAFASQPLESLVTERTGTIDALEWLLAEDSLV